jgi:parallel beta-helix repeat protein
MEKNRIERVCLNTSDAGAIYTGRDWTFGGTVIRQNYITALGAASHHHNWGIYLDDMVAGIEVSENIIANSPSGILVGGGRNNVIKNNLMVNVPLASIRYDSRAMGWAKYHVKKYSGTMWQRLFAMPYKESPWKERFPYLMELKNDKAAQPRHNVIVDNYIINSPGEKLDRVVIKNGVVKNNRQMNDSLTVKLINGKIEISPSLEALTKFEKIHFPLKSKITIRLRENVLKK